MPWDRSCCRSSFTSEWDHVRIVARETGGTSTPLTNANPVCAITWWMVTGSPLSTPNKVDAGISLIKRFSSSAKFHVLVFVLRSANEIGNTTDARGAPRCASEIWDPSRTKPG